MWSATRRGGGGSTRDIVLRPEGTAGVCRAVIQAGLDKTAKMPLAFWYNDWMFRYERPQKGRYRAFRQFGVEIIGASGVQADINVLSDAITMVDRLKAGPFEVRYNFISEGYDIKELRAGLPNTPLVRDESLARGLDYYTGLVFEVFPLEGQYQNRAIAGGGRYDNLMESLGGKPLPAIGFAVGLDRIREMRS